MNNSSNDAQINQAFVEQSLLGGLIIDDSKWYDVKDILSPDDFVHVENRNIYQAICERLEAKQPVDIVTLCKAKDVDFYLLNAIVDRTPTAANVIAYAEMIKEQSDTRQLIERLEQSAERLKQGNVKPDEVTQDLIEKIEASTRSSRGNRFMFAKIETMTIKPINWLIEDFIECNSLTEVFGAPESGKSLLAID